METPADLGKAGKALWAQMGAALPDGWQFDERELAILEAAARQADDVASLQRAIKRDGMMTKGSIGQRRLNAAVVEVRQGRIALSRLLGELSLPDEAKEKGGTAAGKRGLHAAKVRWDREREKARG
jgi:hypothetical protein